MFNKYHFSISRSVITFLLAVCMTAAVLAGSAQNVFAAAVACSEACAAAEQAEQYQTVTSYNKDYSFQVSANATFTAESNNTVSVKPLGRIKGYENRPSMSVILSKKSVKAAMESIKRITSDTDTYAEVSEPQKLKTGGRNYYEIMFSYKDGGDLGIVDVLPLQDGGCAEFSVRCEAGGAGSGVLDQVFSAVDLAVSTFTAAETRTTPSAGNSGEGAVSRKLIDLAEDYLSRYEDVVNNVLPNVTSGEPGLIDMFLYGTRLGTFYKSYKAFKNYYSDDISAADKEYYWQVSSSVKEDVLNRILAIANEWSRSLLWG